MGKYNETLRAIEKLPVNVNAHLYLLKAKFVRSKAFTIRAIG